MTERVNDAILDMLVPNPSRDLRAVAASLSPDDWTSLIGRGREHRFLPQLHWTLEQADALAAVPQDIRLILTETRRHHTLRALSAQRELLLVHRLLRTAEIGHVFLKGAFLAQFAYPHPALRPLRDLDVVVRPQDAARAHAAMVAQGYTPLADAPGMVEACIDQAKHLPGLRSPTGAMLIEVHVNVDSPGGVLAGMEAFRHVTTRTLAAESMPFMDPDDLLVHLCVHAAHFHNFNNGPLIIADIGFLLQSGAVDASRCAARAAELGVTRSVALTLALTESCWGDRWPDVTAVFGPVPRDLVLIARQLCFQSFQDRASAGFAADLAAARTWPDLWHPLKAELFPTAATLAAEFGQPRNPLETGWFILKRWHRILTQRVPQLLGAVTKRSFQADYKRVHSLRKWLG